MIWILFVYVFACTTHQEFSIRCKERCLIKGKEFNIKNEKCYCSEPEEVGKEVFTVETNLKGKVIKNETKPAYSEF